MPDDRLIHKRLGHSEKVNRLTDFEYIVWQAYILSADDFGVMRFSAAALCSDHDRLEGRPAKVVQKALEAVRAAGLLLTFEHQGREYCYQRDWHDFQKIDYPRTTIHPAPPLDHLSPKTSELFGKHPGGWGRKTRPPLGDGSANVPQTLADGSPNVRETFGERSGEITREPLADSRKPVAVSPKPLAAVPLPPTDARSKRPIFKGQRFVVFEWMLDDLTRMLGSHANNFDLHAWFYALDEEAVGAGIVVPQRDGGRWLQERTLAECQRRGLITEPEHKSKLTLALEKASNGW